MACDSLLDVTQSYLEWPRGEATALVTVTAAPSTRWAMRVEQLVEPGT